MATSMGFFSTTLNWKKLFGLANLDETHPLDILDLLRTIKLRELDMTATDEARDIADWREWDLFDHGEAVLPRVNDWGLHGLAVDRSVELQTYDESGVEDYEDDDDPTDCMSMEEIFAMMGREQAEEYMIDKYMPPDELDLLYEFDLEGLFVGRAQVICLASFTMLYSKDALPEDSEDGEHLLRGFQLEKVSSQTEFAVTFRQPLPS